MIPTTILTTIPTTSPQVAMTMITMTSSQEWISTTTRQILPMTQNNNNDDLSVEDDNDTEGIPENDGDEISENNISKNNADETPIVPTKLKNLTDNTGALPPVIRSRTRQQAQETGESLALVQNILVCCLN
jgi:hypothetical protein